MPGKIQNLFTWLLIIFPFLLQMNLTIRRRWLCGSNLTFFFGKMEEKTICLLFLASFFLKLMYCCDCSPVFWSLMPPDQGGICAPVEPSFSLSFRSVHVPIYRLYLSALCLCNLPMDETKEKCDRPRSYGWYNCCLVVEKFFFHMNITNMICTHLHPFLAVQFNIHQSEFHNQLVYPSHRCSLTS